MELQTVLTILAVSYFVGSFPTAYLIGRLHGVDIFTIGSGNMGANNVARAVGMRWGGLVWLVDGLKGMLALTIARQLVAADDRSAAMIVAAIAVVFGHNWSIFATIITGSIRGGKGAATATGTWLLLASPLLIAGMLMLWAAIVALTRYVSLAVLISVGLMSLVIVATISMRDTNPVYVGYLLVPIMIFYRHRGNIQALIKGTERRLGERA